LSLSVFFLERGQREFVYPAFFLRRFEFTAKHFNGKLVFSAFLDLKV